MKLFINEWIVEPFRMLTAIGQLLAGAVALIVLALVIGTLAVRLFRPRPTCPENRGKIPEQDLPCDVCSFVGGPLAGRYLTVPFNMSTYNAIKRPTPKCGEWSKNTLAESAQTVTYNRTGPREFTIVCTDADGEHEWEFQDQSFDHAFGTELIHMDVCAKCHATRRAEAPDFPDDVA